MKDRNKAVEKFLAAGGNFNNMNGGDTFRHGYDYGYADGQAAAQPPRTSGLREALENVVDTSDWPLELQAWGHPLSFIPKLIESADILLHTLAFDGHGWEEHEYAFRAAKRFIEEFNKQMHALAQTDNDGWTVIRDESDLPKAEGEYLFLDCSFHGSKAAPFSSLSPIVQFFSPKPDGSVSPYWTTGFAAWRPIPPYTPPSTGSGDAVEGEGE